MKYINLTRGCNAIVDDEDFEYLNQWRWSCDSVGYAVRHQRKNEYGSNSRKMVKMHITVNKTPIGLETDHINHNRLDNRKCNLRSVSPSQNQANSSKWNTNTSGYRGVCLYNIHTFYNIKKPWGARITINGKKIFKGMFLTKEEAALAYNELAIKYFGEYALLNNIGGICR